MNEFDVRNDFAVEAAVVAGSAAWVAAIVVVLSLNSLVALTLLRGGGQAHGRPVVAAFGYVIWVIGLEVQSYDSHLIYGA